MCHAATVLGISSGIADFLGPYGIRVNSVSPAVVASSLMGPDRIVSFSVSHVYVRHRPTWL